MIYPEEKFLASLSEAEINTVQTIIQPIRRELENRKHPNGLNGSDIKSYVDSYIKHIPHDESDSDNTYRAQRAKVALAWATLHCYHFQNDNEEQLNFLTPLLFRLAYDVKNAEKLPPSIVLRYMEKLGEFAHIVLSPGSFLQNSFLMLPLALIWASVIGGSFIFMGGALLIALGFTVSSTYLFYSALAVTVGLGVSWLLKTLRDSEYNLSQKLRYPDGYDECGYGEFHYSEHAKWEIIEPARDDRHLRAFDNLGFFKDYRKVSPQVIEKCFLATPQL